MLIIAFDLRRAPEMALDQDRIGVSAERHRAGVEHRTTGNHILGLANVGNDRLERQPGAAGHAGEAKRCTHDFQESAAGNGIEPFRSAFRKFAMQGLLEFGAACELFE